MNCPQCQSDVADGAATCPNCGAQLAAAATPSAAPTGAGAGAGAAAGGGTTMKFEASRLSQTDRISGIATLVLLISIFLPWFSVSVGALGISASASGSGTSAHGYLWIVFFISLAIIVYLIARAMMEKLPFELPLAHEQVLLIATGVNLLITLIAWIFKPASGFGAVKVSWAWGSFVALIAAIVAVVPLAIPAIKARRAGS